MAKVQALNEKGWSPESAENTDVVLVQTVPTFVPTISSAVYLSNKIDLTWTSVDSNIASTIQNGFSFPVEYVIYIKHGTSDFTYYGNSSDSTEQLIGLV